MTTAWLLCRGKLQTDCFDINGQSSCFVDRLTAPTACRPVSTGGTNVTQPLQDMLADGSASDGSHGSVCFQQSHGSGAHPMAASCMF